MAFKAFTKMHVHHKQADPKEKDKPNIQCIECYGRNAYIGTKDATVQHLILPSSTNGDLNPVQGKTREGRVRKLGSNNPVVQMRVVPLFNHLLVLWDRSVSALNMFSLEPIPTLQRIQYVSLFELCDSALAAQAGCVQMVTSSSRRKVIRIHVVGADKWEVVKEVTLLQEPVALAVDGGSLCVATCDKYLLCDIRTGCSEKLFPHSHSRQQAFVTSLGQGEFLLNGPESLGMFVMKTGVCQRPPLQWPLEVLAAGICFPYILALQPQVLSVYSMLDQQHKQTVSLSGAKGIFSTPDGVLVFTERDIFSLSLVPFKEQIQALVERERVEEALLLLDGVQSCRPLDSYKELQKTITCLAGFVHFYKESFSEAKDLFLKGELDPREIIYLYPDLQFCLCEDFESQFDLVNKSRDLQVLWQEDRNTFHHYLAFLGDFLSAVRETEQGLKCGTAVDCSLLRLYTELGETENLQKLVGFPNECVLDRCVPVLEKHNRYFALGLLYQSHGKLIDGIETWVKIADGFYKEPSCSDVYSHIVWTLSQLKDQDTVWKFADWALQRNQEIGVRIFTKHPPDGQLETQDIISLLEKYPKALLFYLEFLIHELNNEEDTHHNRLAMAYVSETLQGETDSDLRGKLQQLLWESKFYDIPTVYERVKSTALHIEKAILLSRSGKQSQALQVLVHQEKDLQAAEAFCSKAAEGQDPQFKKVLLLFLLQIYLRSEDLASAAVDLLNNNPLVFEAQKAIQLFPDHWSVQLVSKFLVGSLRETFHQRWMAKLKLELAQAELMQHKVNWMQASKTKFRLDKEQRCKVCQRDFTQPEFVCNPHGELIHTSCTDFSPL
ncbi:Transforming growth factor-beta receptor-associated protein 1 [Channa argus]|uniref:Transforming growth factor-beta receptor-associated protein 1 n=1 Tax=Channa argus TaxID=215402 RepID=A0A6G1QFF3_CHAAH|nr:Transforming growth factor-beta receptor-associated protein 1 [Channa argus]